MKLITFLIITLTTLTSIAEPNILLSWEKKKPSRSSWTKITVEETKKQFNELDKAQDITLFCPSYQMLDKTHRVWVWSELISAMAYYESHWNTTAQLAEPSLGKDVITGTTIMSEGLLQLSYGDKKWAKWCNFDWEADKQLSNKDPNKSIFQPKNNLVCGIGILAKQIKKRGRIILNDSAYWAVLKPSSRYNKVHEIQNKVLQLPFCGGSSGIHKESNDCMNNRKTKVFAKICMLQN